MKSKAKSLLLWSQKYTKTDMLYLAKGGFWLMLGHGIQVASGLVLAIAFARLLPRESFGTYQFVMSFAAILSAFTLSGMSIAIKRALARGNDGALRYGFQTQIIWSSGIVLAGGSLSLYYFINGNTTLASSFLIVGALAPFIEGFSLFKAHLIGKQKFKESAFLGFWRRPIFIVTMLTTLLITDDPALLIFVYFASSAVSAGLLYLLVVKKYNLPITPDSELRNYSKHLSVMGLVSAISGNIDKIFIWTMLGAAPLAVYTLAMLPSSHALKFSKLVGELVFPKYAKKDIATIKRSLPRKILIFFAVCFAATLCYVLVAEFVYSLFFPLYPDAVLLSQIAILALLVKPRMLYDQVFASHAMKQIQYFIRISTLIIKVVLLFILIKHYGLFGAVIAVLLSQIYIAVASIVAFYYISNKPNTKIASDLIHENYSEKN